VNSIALAQLRLARQEAATARQLQAVLGRRTLGGVPRLKARVQAGVRLCRVLDQIQAQRAALSRPRFQRLAP
jgi:hypothetical protein